ncbi:hypothetical protein ACQKNC_12860 [Lysinibacillus sp. NPDC094177]|uniref:hypothetical protein n=1 Tax=Lysinibacillus sp. NPDC094177 TaxID=3390580 RepID=UPI003D05AFDC
MHLRLLAKGLDPSQWEGYEYPLAAGIVENATIIDEVALFEIIKEQVVKWTGKLQDVALVNKLTSSKIAAIMLLIALIAAILFALYYLK